MNPEFLQIVDQLAIWKFFPAGKERGTLAVKLADWCRGDIKRARWLLEQADQFDEYPGPATLSQMIKNKFEPSGALALYSLGDRVFEGPPDCKACRDTGTVEHAGKYSWCDCKAAAELRAEVPDWIEFSNRHRGTRESRIAEELRAAETRRKLERIEGGHEKPK